MGDLLQPWHLIVLAVLFFFYFFPSMIAHQRRAQRETWIILVNLFLGWTVIGWFCCLVWALSDDREPKLTPEQTAANLLKEDAMLPRYRDAARQQALYERNVGTEVPPVK
jgi:type VI protein secretion system component VasK